MLLEDTGMRKIDMQREQVRLRLLCIRQFTHLLEYKKMIYQKDLKLPAKGEDIRMTDLGMVKDEVVRLKPYNEKDLFQLNNTYIRILSTLGHPILDGIFVSSLLKDDCERYEELYTELKENVRKQLVFTKWLNDIKKKEQARERHRKMEARRIR